MDRRVDLAIALGVLAFGIVLFVAARHIALGTIDDPVGPRGVPTFIGMLLMVGGGALTFRRLATWRTDAILVESDGKGDEPGHPASAASAFAGMGMSLAYVVLLPLAGFLIATAALLVGLMWLMGVRSLLLSIGVAVTYSMLIYLTFTLGLSVRLPPGVLEGPLDALGLVR